MANPSRGGDAKPTGPPGVGWVAEEGFVLKCETLLSCAGSQRMRDPLRARVRCVCTGSRGLQGEHQWDRDSLTQTTTQPSSSISKRSWATRTPSCGWPRKRAGAVCRSRRFVGRYAAPNRASDTVSVVRPRRRCGCLAWTSRGSHTREGCAVKSTTQTLRSVTPGCRTRSTTKSGSSAC